MSLANCWHGQSFVSRESVSDFTMFGCVAVPMQDDNEEDELDYIYEEKYLATDFRKFLNTRKQDTDDKWGILVRTPRFHSSCTVLSLQDAVACSRTKASLCCVGKKAVLCAGEFCLNGRVVHVNRVVQTASGLHKHTTVRTGAFGRICLRKIHWWIDQTTTTDNSWQQVWCRKFLQFAFATVCQSHKFGVLEHTCRFCRESPGCQFLVLTRAHQNYDHRSLLVLVFATIMFLCKQSITLDWFFSDIITVTLYNVETAVQLSQMRHSFSSSVLFKTCPLLVVRLKERERTLVFFDVIIFSGILWEIPSEQGVTIAFVRKLATRCCQVHSLILKLIQNRCVHVAIFANRIPHSFEFRFCGEQHLHSLLTDDVRKATTTVAVTLTSLNHPRLNQRLCQLCPLDQWQIPRAEVLAKSNQAWSVMKWMSGWSYYFCTHFASTYTD